MRTHLKTHSATVSGEKSNKCNQCAYACSQAGNLRTHLKTHSGERSNKCNQCDFASSQAGNLRRHLKTHSGEKSNQCISVITNPLVKAISGDIHTGEKSNKCNQCNYASSRIWQFEDSFENTQWRKVKQMQSV